MWTNSRREFAAFLLAPFLRTLHGQPAGEGAPSRITSRTYRADAVILLLGMVIFRRSGVGGGQASMEESGEGEALRRTLFFVGGSDPKRAHGLNRLGWIRETVSGPASSPLEAGYFGVMTSSPEESLENARKTADASAASGHSTFSAVSGRNTVGRTRSAVTHFEYSAAAIWTDRGLIDQAQATFRDGAVWRENAWPKSPNQTPSTFLLELATLLKQRTRKATGRYVYSEQEYTLELESAPVGKDRLLPVKGKIRNLRTGKESLFRVWLEEGSDSVVPVRIEYQARSFLRLTFEAVNA